jgi:hypothetical protein
MIQLIFLENSSLLDHTFEITTHTLLRLSKKLSSIPCLYFPLRSMKEISLFTHTHEIASQNPARLLSKTLFSI